MSLVHASKRAVGRGACLRSSYAEISRFVRTQRHRIMFDRAPLCSRVASRSIASSQPDTQSLSTEHKIRKALDEFKESSMLIVILDIRFAHVSQLGSHLGSISTMTGAPYGPQHWVRTELVARLRSPAI